MNIVIRDTGKKITDVLKLLAEGYSYDSICARLSLTPIDIMMAARIAGEIVTKMAELRGGTTVSGAVEFVVKEGRFVTLDNVRKKYPRAYEPWAKDEDGKLMELYQNGRNIKEIAEILQRTAGSIKARIDRLFPPKIEQV